MVFHFVTGFVQHISGSIQPLPSSWKPNLVITGLTGDENRFLSLNRFIWSLRQTKSEAHVLIFHPESDHFDPLFYESRFGNVSTLPYHPTGHDHPFVHERFVQYSNFMKENAHKYNKVLLVDTDAVFPRDPFETLKLTTGESGVPSVQLYAENPRVLMGGCRYHREWVGCTVGGWNKVPEEIRNATRICAGTTFGNSEGIRKYLQLMAEILLETHCNDQGIHNYLYYYGVLESQGVKVEKVELCDSLVANLSTTDKIRLNALGDVLNGKGEVYSVVHHFTYGKALNALYDQRWPFELQESRVIDHDLRSVA
ncbi:hypothetical protein HDU98_006802 [Podochytrium sp. JEL0797]|nr:hypothetical protein HDU98_006802 [Podochytrium sp. JEL0797]